jgi:hypothetical protein
MWRFIGRSSVGDRVMGSRDMTYLGCVRRGVVLGLWGDVVALRRCFS